MPAAPQAGAFELLFAPAPAPISGGGVREAILLDIRNRFSSTEHYYHFVLGFLAPLCLRLGELRNDRTYIIRSCGPMDVHIRALGLSNVETMPKQLFATRLKQAGADANVLLGYDAQAMYDGQAFGRMRDIVIARLGIARRPSSEILLIGRGKSPDFYQSEAAEVKTSANLRRSIPNMEALSEAVAAAGLAPRLTELETASLADQVAMFANARAVVAQHGAALVNMVWMAPGSVVVEINPKAREDSFVDCFRELARVCGHRYIHVPQDSTHAAVPPAVLLEAMRGAFPDIGPVEIDPRDTTPQDDARAPPGGWPAAALPVSRMHLPAWKGRFEKTCALLAAHSFDVVWMGDSIVQQFEYGGPEPWQDYAPIWETYYRPRNSINLGFSGDDTTHLLWRLLNGHLKLGPAKVVILLIGTNNFGKTQFDAEDTVCAIARMAGLIADRFPAIRIIVLSIFPNGRGEAANIVLRGVNEKLSLALQAFDQAVFLDISDIFLRDGEVDLGKFRDPLQGAGRPAIHPNAAAQAVIAARVEPVLAEVLQNRAAVDVQQGRLSMGDTRSPGR